MSKKKEQVKFLKKKFASVVKAFGKEKNKQKRKEAFELLCGRIAEFEQYDSTDSDKRTADQPEEAAPAVTAISPVQPSPALVDELRAVHHTTHN